MTVDVLMKIDPKQIAKMITEDPNVAPSDHFDDTEDEYIDDNVSDFRRASDEMYDWGDSMVSYLNTNKHTPADFIEGEDFPATSFEAVFNVIEKSPFCGGHFDYGHPTFKEFMGEVYFSRRSGTRTHPGVWKYEWNYFG